MGGTPSWMDDCKVLRVSFRLLSDCVLTLRRTVVHCPVGGDSQHIQLSSDKIAANPLPLGNGQDRKSTRLNSSHRCISYAVFCLKKKRGVISARTPTSPK